MSQWWIVPNWNESQQQDANDRSNSHVHFPNKTNPSFSHDFAPLPKYEPMELAWESEDQQEAAMDDTLESIVHSSLSRKRTRSNQECKDEISLISWASTDQSHKSYETENSVEDLPRDDGSSMNKDQEEHNTKRKTNGSCGQTRAARNYNQSERRRRDRINQKMKDLQKLVPNGRKMDRASLLDGTIQYLKQLQAQVQFMCSIKSSTVSQMVIPLEIQQQQIQMSLLAAHMGLLHTDSVAASSSSSFPCATAFPPFLLPSLVSTTKPKSNFSTSAFVPPTDPFCTFLAQTLDMDFYSKMVTLYCQEMNSAPRRESKSIQSQCTEGVKENSIRTSQMKL